jgi:protein O-mannosyl-transferase
VLDKMSQRIWRSAAVAVLFAVHPLHVESVAWIAERKDVLSTFFWLLTLMSYVRYVRHPSFKAYGLMTVFYILGLASKPMLVTLPFTLMLLDFWPLQRWNLPRAAHNFPSAGKSGKSLAGLTLEKLPLFLLAFISCVITLYAQKDAIKTFELFPLTTRISNALVSYMTYLEKTVWPFDLSIFYPFHDLPPLKVALSAAALAVISRIVYAFRKKSPYLMVGWLWFLGTLIPVIGLVQVGGQSMADKYTYIPLTGIFIMSVWGIADCLEKRTSAKTVLVILSFFPLAFYSAVTFHQAGFWKNSETLFKHALETTHGNDIALYDLGISSEKKGDTESAIVYYQEALKINPRLYGAHNNLGVLLAGKGKTDESIQHFLAALKSNPRQDDAYYNLGMVYYRNGDIPRAIDCFQKAIRENKYHKKAVDMLVEARKKSPK